jgi:hypothetical protein
MNNTTHATDTIEIAGSVRYWMIRLKQERSSVALRQTLNVSTGRARDLYFGRRPFTFSELLAVSDWLDVPYNHLLEGGTDRDREVGALTETSSAVDTTETARILENVAKGLTALVWNTVDANPREDFLDLALYNEIRMVVDKGAEWGKRGALEYCMRITLSELSDQLRLLFPDRPPLDSTAVQD